MDSDLSLVEIGEEDDSLLFQKSNEDALLFACSPLQLPRSKRSAEFSSLSSNEGLRNIGEEDHGCFSRVNSNNKENLNENASETLKVSNDPQQMKRRKKGGGYNLRKSLAWNKAFFTEEGVLDSTELSLLRGNFNTLDSKALPAIHEEPPDGCDSNTNSADLQELEETLIRKSNQSTSENGEGSSASLVQKCASPASINRSSSAVKGKPLLPRRGAKVGAKNNSSCLVGPSLYPFLVTQWFISCSKFLGYCSLRLFKLEKISLTWSMQKRTMNLSTGKGETKGLKIPRIPAKKAGISALPPPTKSAVLDQSRSKCNRIAQSGALNGRKFGADTASFSVISSNQHSKKNLASSTLEKNSSSRLRPPILRKTTGTLGEVRDTEHPVSAKPADKGHIRPNVGQPSSQASSPIGGGIQHAKLQMAKPTGLRMPSPSLGFFAQSIIKPQEKNLPQSCISNLQKVDGGNHVREPTHSPALNGRPKVVNDFKKNMDIEYISTKPLVISDPLHLEQVNTLKFGLTDDYMEKSTAKPLILETSIKFDQGQICNDTDQTSIEETRISGDFQQLGSGSIVVLSSKQNCAKESNQSSTSGHIGERPFHSTVEREEKDEIVDNVSFKFQDLIESGMDIYDGLPQLTADRKGKDGAAIVDGMIEKSCSRGTTYSGNMAGANVSPMLQGPNQNDLDISDGLSHLIAEREQKDDAVVLNGMDEISCFREAKLHSDYEPEANVCPSLHSPHCSELGIYDGPSQPTVEREEKYSAAVMNGRNEKSCMGAAVIYLGDELGVDASPTVEDPNVDICEHLSQPIVERQEEDIGAVMDSMIETSCMGEAKIHSGNNSGAESGSELSFPMPDKHNRFDVIQAHFEEQTSSQNSYKGGEQVLQETCAVLSSDRLLQEERVLLGISEDDYVLQTCAVLNQNENAESEDKSHPVVAQRTSTREEVIFDQDKTIEPTQKKDAISGSSNVDQSSKYRQNGDKVSNEVDLCGAGMSLGCESSFRLSKDELPEEPMTCDHRHEERDLSDPSVGTSLNGSSSRVQRVTVLKIDIPPKDTETLQSSNSSTGGLCKLETDIDLSDDRHATIPLQPVADSKVDSPAVRPHPDAVPFSDEWLAAIEAAGEEILTKKSGAVQHSPPVKSQPEPGPWSPVKRKSTQVLGPFDCTKFMAPHSGSRCGSFRTRPLKYSFTGIIPDNYKDNIAQDNGTRELG
ncbi:hypothetical protein RJ641_008567 [Dillenia turbinata]|uniref:Uncharacterized protein n=1 Tax=Dillenia turbinata TaxID=194707 RepID=A0AAN8VFW1_9MAGN